MNSRFCLVSSLLTASLLLGTTDPAQAQLTGTDVESFRYINQSIPIKVAVTTAGLSLMGLELWWFLLSRAKAKTEEESSEVAFAGNAQGDLLDATSNFSAVPEATPKATPVQTEPAQPDQSPPEQFAASLCSIHNGIEMARGVLMVECKMQPTFSAA
ncbi:MAG: hypothetical protein ABG776_15400 [Cyanobacteria bacterium J06555_13]